MQSATARFMDIPYILRSDIVLLATLVHRNLSQLPPLAPVHQLPLGSIAERMPLAHILMASGGHQNTQFVILGCTINTHRLCACLDIHVIRLAIR